MRVSVTNEDIIEAINLRTEPGYSFNCPIALAGRRIFPGKYPQVSGNSLKVYHCNDMSHDCLAEAVYFLPPDAEYFMHTFDMKYTVRPIEFELY